MNLSNFDSNSNLNLSNRPSSTAPVNVSQRPSPTTSLAQVNATPTVLQDLGKKIQDNTESFAAQLADSKEIDPSRVKNFEHLTQELQSIFSKTNQLMQKSYNDDSSLIHQEIDELDDEVTTLESQLAKSLSGKELQKLLNITKEFHDILKLAESYLAFKERFLAVDEQLSKSLELIPASLYSDLHGWSPAAAKGATESLEHLRTLIKMTIPILEQKGAFTPEILAQLASSIRAGSLAFSDSIHALAAKYTHVLSVAQDQWTLAEAAFEARPSVEGYIKMQLYGKQLQNMQKVFEQLQNLPDTAIFKWMASRLEQQMQTGEVGDEYSLKKNIRNDLQLMQASLADTNRLVKNHASQLDGVTKDIRLEEKLAKAEEAVAKMDLKTFIQNIRKEYESGERSLDRYVTAKCRLGDIPKSYEKAIGFCTEEELHFVQEKGYAIDFDELVQVEMMKLGQPKPGLFSRLWQAMPDPANWSDTTKRWVHNSLIGLQLGDQILKMAPSKPNPAVAENTSPTLSKEDQERLADERSLIGNLLDVKFEVFKKDPTQIDRLSKGKPEVGNFFRALIERYPQKPSAQDSRILMDRYEVYRTDVLLNSGSQKTLDWVLETTNPPVKAQSINSSPKQLAATSSKTTETALPKVETPLFTAQNVENIREAVKEIAVLDHQLQQCSRMEFLKPSLSVTPKALLELRQELDILKHSLAGSMENKPVEQSAEWNLAVQQQCHDLRDLETRIGAAMSAYEEARAMNNYYNYNSLDVLGNKHKNLVKQAHLTEALGVEGLNVPMPQGLESHKVMAFLKNYAPEVFEHWDQIRTISKANGKSGVLDNAEVVSHLKAIDEGIEKAFLKAATDNKAFTNLGITQEMKEWLAELAKEGKHLMVRSTGAEDSKKSANAGGNASIAYVKPTQEELSQALGEVVRSYFSAGSLQKRLNANLDPFEDELRVAVTTQELIGEPLGGATDPADIPISLVLFTNEPLYIGDEKFRAMRISATYGHGEGVVGNRGIASDTALVLISASDPSKLYILYDNQEKPERLAPMRDPVTGKITLEKIANSAEMVKTPSLNNELVSRLYTWGVIGEKYFEDNTDMEIVVKGGTIYPVQGRPINRGKLFATYLDPKKIAEHPETPVKQTLMTEMIVPGKASVVEIAKPEEILVVETLEKAEGLFKKRQHKLVIVGQEEPANSHPVVNFSALGMPCLYAKDLSEIQKLAGQVNPSIHLAVCVQAGTVSLWDTSKGKIEDFTSEGFVVHPAKIAVSLPFKDPLAQKAGVVADVPENVKASLYFLRTATNNKDALTHFNALKNDPWIKSLDAKIDELEDKVAKQPLFELTVRPTIEVAKSLKKRIDDAFLEVEALLSQSVRAERLQFLMHVKTLETLLFQKPVSSGAILQKSLLTMQESFAAADEMMIYQSQLQHPAHFIDILMDGTESPLETVYDEWSKFLLKLEPIAESVAKGQNADITQEEISRFKTTLHTLRQGEVLPLFMTFFLSSMDLTDPIRTVKAIIASLPSSEKAIIEQIFVHKKEIGQLKNDVVQIANSKTYAEMLSKLEKSVEVFFPEVQAWLKKEQWEKSSLITRSIALQAMNELVDLYDTAIKTMKASQEIGSDIEKTRKFKEMLGPYLKLLESWTQGIVGMQNYEAWLSVGTYMDKVKNIFIDLSDTNPDNLRPSSQFSVSAALLGGRPLAEMKFPDTLEDVFTLTHQNLLASTALLSKKLFSENQIQSSPLPQLLKSADELIRKISGRVKGAPFSVGTPQLIGIEVGQKGIIFSYNVPMRNHSGKLSIYYDRTTEKISIKGLLLGEGRERWGAGRERLEILNFANILPLQTEVKVAPQELAFVWDISTGEQLEKACDEYQTQALDSLSEGIIYEKGNTDIEDFLNEVTKAKDISALASFVVENKNMQDVYGQKIIILKNLHDSYELGSFSGLTDPSFVKLLSLQYPFIYKLRHSIISHLKGVGIDEILNDATGREKSLMESALVRFQNEPALIYQLPINYAMEEIWAELVSQPNGTLEIFVRAQEQLISLDSKQEKVKLVEVVKKLLARGYLSGLQSGHGVSEALEFIQQGMQEDRGVKESTFVLLVEITKHCQRSQEWVSKVKLMVEALLDSSNDAYFKYKLERFLRDIEK